MTDEVDRPKRKTERRTGRDRRSGSIRKSDRRTASAPPAAERRSGSDRRKKDRRDRVPRRIVPDRRKRTTAPPSRLTPRDRDRARRLPDEVAAVGGTLEQRLARLTRQMWPNFPLPVRAALIEALLPVLEPVTKGKAATEEMRRQCEEAVERWIAKYR